MNKLKARCSFRNLLEKPISRQVIRNVRASIILLYVLIGRLYSANSMSKVLLKHNSSGLKNHKESFHSKILWVTYVNATGHYSSQSIASHLSSGGMR